VAGGEQRVHDVRADEPCPTGNEHFHTRCCIGIVSAGPLPGYLRQFGITRN
jgi:hypothetical protein